MMKKSRLSTLIPSYSFGKFDVSNLKSWVLEQWFKNIRFGTLVLIDPIGNRKIFNGAQEGPTGVIEICNYRLFYRVLMGGDIGFAESYIAGDWKTPNLTDVLLLAALNFEALSRALTPLNMTTQANRLRHFFNKNTKRGSRRNIAAHYDLGNTFYQCWLDETMTYSSGLFERSDEEHSVAQRRKYLRIAKILDIKEKDYVLEVGCGWGGFAEFLSSEYGCKVLGITISSEQEEFSRERIFRAGLSDRVEIRLEDYRDVKGNFDKIVSIEMFEAVGEKNWGTYFSALKNKLKPRGRAALQIITVTEEVSASYRENPDFIQLFVFPGGMLPTPSAIHDHARHSNFIITDSFYFGKSYAETLRRWNVAFQNNWVRIQEFNFDMTFYRMWRYYLCYCEAGFEHGRINVGQFLLEHG